MKSSKLLVACAALAGVAAPLAFYGCNDTSCASGTIDRNGQCQPADDTVNPATCGSNTMLVGNTCVPVYPPTQCDPATTTPSTGSDGVITCIGNGGGGGCSGAFACPTPTDGNMTVCGQFYNLEDNTLFQGQNPTGQQCGSAGAASGPCALMILAFDALAYGADPTGTAPLTTGPVYIDDCGRYRVTEIPKPPSGPFVALGIDDAGMPLGPAGVTNTTGVAFPFAQNNALSAFEAWVVPSTTTDKWAASGGPPVSGGIYVGIYRQHICTAGNNAGCTDNDPFAEQTGVTITKSGATEPDDDYYFTAEITRDTIDGSASATSENGTVLLTGASTSDGLVYSGTGGITDTTDCKWETHPAASLANVVFLQVYRPMNATPTVTCTQ